MKQAIHSHAAILSAENSFEPLSFKLPLIIISKTDFEIQLIVNFGPA